MLSNISKVGIKESLIKASIKNANIGIRAFSTKSMYYPGSLEWVKLSDKGVATVGLTPFGAKRLGKINFVELPKTDAKFKEEQKFGVLGSSNETAYSLYSPISGKVLEVNEKLLSDPHLLQNSKDNWMIKLKVDNKDEFKHLMSKKDFDKFIKWYRT